MFAEVFVMLLQAAGATAAPSQPAPAAAQMTIEQYCQTHACRHDVDVSLRDRSGNVTHLQRKLMPPAVEPNLLSVFPGEKIEAVAEFSEGKFVRWRVPNAQDGPEAIRISIELKQNRVDPGMIATIENTGPKTLKLSMGIVAPGPNAKPHGTSSCPVLSKGSSFESWPDPVLTLLVRGARVVADKEKVGCE